MEKTTNGVWEKNAWRALYFDQKTQTIAGYIKNADILERPNSTIWAVSVATIALVNSCPLLS